MRFITYRSSAIVGFALTWLLGLWLAHTGLRLPLWLGLAGVAAAIVALKWRALFLTALMLGIIAGLLYGAATAQHYRLIQSLINQKIVISGVVQDDPGRDDKGYTSFTLGNLRYRNQSLDGNVTVRSLNNAIQRGYEIEAAGKLTATLGSKQGQIGFAQITIISNHQNWLERQRQRFIAGVRTSLPDPLSGFALGLLIGARALIPKSLQNELTTVGLSHLVAVSGYNLTIIVLAVRRIFTKTSRFVTLMIPLWLIGGFVAVAGTSASIVRAALVSTLSLIAYYYGRNTKPLVIIAFPAVLTTLWRPEYLWSDLGWQLSFLAFVGVLVLAPMLEAGFKRPNWIKRLMVEATTAQILTFPLILAVFHQFSVVGLLANVIILPMVPLAMLTSLAAGLIGMFVPLLTLFAWPAYGLLKLMVALIHYFAGIPWASLDLSASVALVVAVYASISLAIIALGRRRRLGQNDIMEANDKPASLATLGGPRMATNVIDEITASLK